MTDLASFVRLEPDHVAIAPYGDTGMWVVGFVFSDKDAGVEAIRSVAELYNATASLVHGECQDNKERK